MIFNPFLSYPHADSAFDKNVLSVSLNNKPICLICCYVAILYLNKPNDVQSL